MVHRIRKAGIFRGMQEMRNTTALRRLNKIKRKPVRNGDKMDQWMKQLGFLKEYRLERRDAGNYSRILWWVRE